MQWDVDVPLLSDPMIAGATVRALLLAATISAGLISLLMAAQGDYAAIGPVWLGFGAVAIGLVLLGFVVMWLVFGNRLHFRYELDEDGISCTLVDRRARASNRLLVTLGVLLRRPQAVGAGLIAQVQEQQVLRWRGAFHAEHRPRRRQIVLRNRWRALMLVYATPENHTAVAARIDAEIERHGSSGRLPLRSPLPRYLAWTGLLLLACLPLLASVEAFDVPLILPLLQVCFGLATLWLIGLFGWVMLAVDLGVLLALAADALRQRESWLHPGQHYAGWTVYDSGDWMLLLAVALGLLACGWIGWRGLRGRLPALLVADFGDSGA